MAADGATELSINPTATDKTDALAYEKYLHRLQSFSWPPRVVPAVRMLEVDLTTLATASERDGKKGDFYQSPQLLAAAVKEVTAEGRVEYTLGIVSDESQLWETTSGRKGQSGM
jgi:hypothetical protein